jgi:hypothetical protein
VALDKLYLASHRIVVPPGCISSCREKMMRDGMITFSDLAGRLKVLRVDCDRCGRHGRYLVDKLIYDHGPDAKLIEWFSKAHEGLPAEERDGRGPGL